MSDHSSRSVSSVEQEVEQTRSQISATLNELRHKMAPGAVVDSMVGYASENGGADFLRNLGNQVRANPLPVTLIGAGIAWLAMSSSRAATNGERSIGHNVPMPGHRHDGGRSFSASNSSSSEPGFAQRVGATAANGAGSVSDTASGLASSVRSTVSSVGDTVAAAYGSVSDTAHSIRSRVADGASAASGVARTGYKSINHGYETASGLADKLKEQPLVTLALGVALGAAIGAALPSTDTENEYLGAASDSAREQAQEMASEQLSNVQETATEAFEAVKAEVRKQGLTSDGPSEILSGLGDKLGAVAGAAKSAVNEGVERSSKNMASATDGLGGRG